MPPGPIQSQGTRPAPAAITSGTPARTPAPQQRPSYGNSPIDLKAEFEKVRKQYEETTREKFNALIVGDYGTGKSFMLRTARTPVLVHSFDPGGSKCLEDFIDAGKIIADNRYESDDAAAPAAFRLWEAEFDRLKKGGVFDQIGTYSIDSLSGMERSLMNAVLKARGRAPAVGAADLKKDSNFVPEIQDYLVVQKVIVQYLGLCCALPCDFILTAHLQTYTDPISGQTHTSVLVDGKKFPEVIPTLFDEVWVATTEGSPSGTKYFFMTAPSGRFKARSRLSKGGRLAAKEEQNITAILKKAGYTWTEKSI